MTRTQALKRVLLYAAQPYAVEILRPLQAAAQRRGCRVCWFFETAASGRHLLRDDEQVLEDIAAVQHFQPEAVFVPGNTVPDIFPGVKVEVFHGFNAHKRTDERGHFRIRGLFDLYCTQGPSTTEPFQRLAAEHGHFDVVETGWPKLDPLFAADASPIEVPAGRPVILYTSTFTPRLSSAAELYPVIKRLAATRDWFWLVTLHPKMDPALSQTFQELAGDNLRYYPPGNLIPLFKAADLMVSDTSSTVPEFLLQEKPVVTLRNQRPGPHILNVTEPEAVEEAIERGLQRPAQWLAAAREYAAETHPHRDGRSSERVLDAVTAFIAERRHERLRRKPLNLIRRFKVRRSLGYYRWR